MKMLQNYKVTIFQKKLKNVVLVTDLKIKPVQILQNGRYDHDNQITIHI